MPPVLVEWGMNMIRSTIRKAGMRQDNGKVNDLVPPPGGPGR